MMMQAFFSALDADSEGIEGKFYTWQKEEIDKILKKDSSLFCEYYDVTGQGNWEHANILRVLKPLALFAEEKQLDASLLEDILSRCRCVLMSERDKRIRPGLDDKIMLSWNALMNTALSKAYAATGEIDFKELATLNMAFLEKNLSGGNDGGWFHTFKNNEAKYPAFLDDYAYLIQAYINLQEITGEGEYLIRAKLLCEYVIQHFEEADTGLFFFTNQSQKMLFFARRRFMMAPHLQEIP